MNADPLRHLLPEVLLLERTARALPRDAALEDFRRLLEGPAPSDVPRAERFTARLFWRRRARPHGLTWSFRRSPFFLAEPVAFLGIVPPQGRPAVVFERVARPDLAPAAQRLAVERVFAGNGWRFPEDLVRPEVLATVLELFFVGSHRLTPTSPPPPRLEGATGALGFTGLWVPGDGREDSLRLQWTPERLGLHSERFGALL